MVFHVWNEIDMCEKYVAFDHRCDYAIKMLLICFVSLNEMLQALHSIMGKIIRIIFLNKVFV